MNNGKPGNFFAVRSKTPFASLRFFCENMGNCAMKRSLRKFAISNLIVRTHRIMRQSVLQHLKLKLLNRWMQKSIVNGASFHNCHSLVQSDRELEKRL